MLPDVDPSSRAVLHTLSGERTAACFGISSISAVLFCFLGKGLYWSLTMRRSDPCWCIPVASAVLCQIWECDASLYRPHREEILLSRETSNEFFFYLKKAACASGREKGIVIAVSYTGQIKSLTCIQNSSPLKSLASVWFGKKGSTQIF